MGGVLYIARWPALGLAEEPGLAASVLPDARRQTIKFLSLTEPILALCVEVDREACELRYADPFPESHHRMLP